MTIIYIFKLIFLHLLRQYRFQAIKFCISAASLVLKYFTEKPKMKEKVTEMFIFKNKCNINMKVITMSMLLASATFALSNLHKYTYEIIYMVDIRAFGKVDISPFISTWSTLQRFSK